MAHKDIRIPFEIENKTTGERRRFEAIGFLYEGESFCLGNEALRRTADKNGGAISDKDAAFLWECNDQFPRTLDRYWLITNRRSRPLVDSRLVSCLALGDACWIWLDRDVDEHYLIVRRCQ